MSSSSFKWDTGSENRAVPFPAFHNDIMQLYRDSRSGFWVETETYMGGDKHDYEYKLKDVERNLVKYILSYFARIDMAIGPIISHISDRIDCIETKIVYTENAGRENIHALSYLLQIKAIADSTDEIYSMINASTEDPIIKSMCDFATKYFDDNISNDIGYKLITMAAIEGVMFSAAFAFLQWFRDRRLLLGITNSNTLIARDEGLHTKLSCLLVRKYLINKPTQETVNAIFEELIVIMDNFITAALPEDIGIMSVKAMKEYVRFQTDCIIQDLGYAPLYYAKNSLEFMAKLSLNSQGKANFFETETFTYSMDSSNEIGCVDYTIPSI